jgi:protein-tyrosine phosphatase
VILQIFRKTLGALFMAALIGLGGCAGPKISRQAIPFTQASVSSVSDHRLTIAWSGAGIAAVSMYAGTDPAHIGQDHPAGRGGAAGEATIGDLPQAARWYFKLVPDHGAPLIIADRSLHLASAPNFRDAGGYRTTDGKWVRMGLLYRSDQLDRLSPADLDTLHADRIHLVCDLRTDIERTQGMDRLPPGAEALIADVAGPSSSSSDLVKALSDPAMAERLLAGGKGAQFMIDANRQFVSSPSALLAYGDVFERLANPAMLPAVFHCTAGKDRSGWAQAVFLSIMGVPRETIMADYLLSNSYLEAKNQRMLAMTRGHIDPAWLEPLLGVRSEYLDAAFDEVDKRYGSMDAYLHRGLGLSDATLQALRREFLAGA